jgi:hypothetical protein
MSCPLPSSPNLISIFLDSKTESEAFVASNVGDDRDKVFIGRLNLERLGLKDQISRKWGNFSTLFIARNHSNGSSLNNPEGAK